MMSVFMVHLSKTLNQLLLLIMHLSIIWQLHTMLLSIKTTAVLLLALIAVLEYITVSLSANPFGRYFESIGGIGIIEMLFCSNILAFVGRGDNPQYPRNKVMIWDDHQNHCISELCFRSEVRSMRLRRECIVVVLEHKIFVYNFSNLKLLFQIETTTNPKGLCEVSQTSGPLVLVCPGLQKGQVWVEYYASKITKSLVAHDSVLACFALTKEGNLLATASTKGTLIRIFNMLEGTLLQEVRRGLDRAEIYNVSFSPTAQWLAVSSDKGTVHVFSLKVNLGT